MSTSIDERVAVLKFDNAQFERAIRESSKSLENFKKGLRFDKVSSSLGAIEKAISKVSFSHMERALDSISNRFTLVGMVGLNAMNRISNAAINAGESVAKLVTGIEGIKDGFREYETQMGAVQTIMANTASKGTTLEQVNAALDELNTYADKTIYNFTEMTRNIGTFTAAGVDLETSTAAIKGIANLAAVSGSTSQQASTAMYQLSQALASGTVKLMDWNSVVNAGMGGQVFQDALKETARVHGIAVDQMIEQEGSFRESLSQGWLTTDVLLETLQKFTGDLGREQLAQIGYTEEQINAIEELGVRARDAATEVKTFSQLRETLAEAAGSGWSQTFKILVGDFNEAKELWTGVSQVLEGMINTAAQNRNTLLEETFGNKQDQKITLDRWREFENTGFASDSFIESLKYNARAAGVEIDDLIEQYGSFEASLQAGWLTQDMFQSAIDWNADSTRMHFEWSKGLVAQIAEGYFGDEDQTREAVESLGYNYDLYKSLADKYMNPEQYGELDWDAIWNDDQMLDALGVQRTTEEFKSMETAIYDTESALNSFLGSSPEGQTGREVLLEALAIVGQQLIDIFNIIGEAWNEAFPPLTSDTLFNLVQGFRDLVEGAKLTDDQAGQLKTIFTGLFDAIGIVGDVLGVVFEALGRVFSLGEGDTKPLQFILDFFEAIATKVSSFRSFLKAENKLSKATTILTGVFNTLFTVLSGVAGLFTSVIKGEDLDFSFLDSLKSTFSNLGESIGSITLKPISDFLAKIKNVFAEHGINFDWLDDLIEKLSTKTLGSLFGGTGESPFEKLKNAVFGENFDPRNFITFGNLDPIEAIGNAINKIRDLFSLVKSVFPNIDFSNFNLETIVTWFSQIKDRIQSKFEEIKNKFSELDFGFVGQWFENAKIWFDNLNLPSMDFQTIKNWFSTIINTVRSKFDIVKNKFDELDFGFVGQWFADAKAWFEGIEIDFGPIDTIISKLESLVGWIRSFFSGSSGATDIAAPAKALRDASKSNMQLSRDVIWLTGGSGAPEEIHEGIDQVFSFIDDLKTKLEEFTNSEAFKGFLEFITNAKDLLPILLGAYGILRIKSFFNGLKDAITDFTGGFSGDDKSSMAETFLAVAGGVDLICDGLARILKYPLNDVSKGLGEVFKAMGALLGGTALTSLFTNKVGGVVNGTSYVMMGIAIRTILGALGDLLDCMKEEGVTEDDINHAVFIIGALEAITGLFTGLGEGLAGVGGISGLGSFGMGFAFIALSNAVSNLIGAVADVVTLFNESGIEPTEAETTLGWLGTFANKFKESATETLGVSDEVATHNESDVYNAVGVVGALELFTGAAVGLATKVMRNSGTFVAFNTIGTAISFAALGHAVGEMMEAVDTVIGWEEKGISQEQIDHAALVVGSLEGFTGVTVGIASALNNVSSGITTPNVGKATSKLSKGVTSIKNYFGASSNMFSGFGIYSAAKGMNEISDAVEKLAGLKYDDLVEGANIIRECFGSIITGEVIATIALTAMNLRSVETALMAIGVAFGMFSWGMNQYTDAILRVKNAVGEGEVTKEDFEEYGSMVMSSFASGLQDPEVLTAIQNVISGVFEEITRTIFALFINVYNLLASLFGPIVKQLFGEAPKMISSYTMDENGLITVFMSSDEENIDYESLGMGVVDIDALQTIQNEQQDEIQKSGQEFVDENPIEVPLEEQIRYLYNIATTDVDENGRFRTAEEKEEAWAQAAALYEKDIYDRAFDDAMEEAYRGERNIAVDAFDYAPSYRYSDMASLDEYVDTNGIARNAHKDAYAIVDEMGDSYGEYLDRVESSVRDRLITKISEMASDHPNFNKEALELVMEYLRIRFSAEKGGYDAHAAMGMAHVDDRTFDDKDFEFMDSFYESIFTDPGYTELTDAAVTDVIDDAMLILNTKTTEQDLSLGGIKYLVKDAGDVSVVWDVATGRQVVQNLETGAYELLEEGATEISEGFTGDINISDFVAKGNIDKNLVKTYQEYIDSAAKNVEFSPSSKFGEATSIYPFYKPLQEAVENGEHNIGKYLHPSQFDFMTAVYGDPDEVISKYTDSFTWRDILKFIEEPTFVRNAQHMIPMFDSIAGSVAQSAQSIFGFFQKVYDANFQAYTQNNIESVENFGQAWGSTWQRTVAANVRAYTQNNIESVENFGKSWGSIWQKTFAANAEAYSLSMPNINWRADPDAVQHSVLGFVQDVFGSDIGEVEPQEPVEVEPEFDLLDNGNFADAVSDSITEEPVEVDGPIEIHVNGKTIYRITGEDELGQTGQSLHMEYTTATRNTKDRNVGNMANQENDEVYYLPNTEAMQEAVNSAFSGLMDPTQAYNALMAAIEDAKTKAAAGGKDIGDALAEGDTEGVSSKHDEAVTTAGTLVEDQVTAMENAGDVHSPSGKTMLIGEGLGDGLVVGIRSKKSDVDNSSKEIIQTILKKLGDNLEQYSEKGKAIIQFFANGITSASSFVQGAISQVMTQAASAFQGHDQAFYNAGFSAVQGFALGISENSSRAIDAAAEVAARSLSAAKAAIDSDSPSKKFEELGLWSDQGFALGFLRNSHIVENASTQVGTSAIDRMKSAIKTVNDAMNNDLPSGPTIRPVMDLSEFQNQNSRLHKTLNSYGDQMYGKLVGIDENTANRGVTQVFIDGAVVNDTPEIQNNVREMLTYYKRLGLMR